MLGRLCRLTCQVVHEMNGRHSDGFPIDVEIAEELPDEGPGTTPGYIAWPGAAGGPAPAGRARAMRAVCTGLTTSYTFSASARPCTTRLAIQAGFQPTPTPGGREAVLCPAPTACCAAP